MQYGHGTAIEKKNERLEDHSRKPDWGEARQGDTLGLLQSHAFRNKLAKDDLQCRKTAQGRKRRNRKGRKIGTSGGGNETSNMRREIFVSVSAKHKTGESYSHLAAGDEIVELSRIIKDLFELDSLFVAFQHELIDCRSPDAHRGKLGSNEQGVDTNQEQDYKDRFSQHAKDILADFACAKISTIAKPVASKAIAPGIDNLVDLGRLIIRFFAQSIIDLTRVIGPFCLDKLPERSLPIKVQRAIDH
jgi:hypothetical protein